MTDEPKQVHRIADVDWKHWQPTEKATLLFVIKNGRILLIHKKKGLGAGKINGPGGRIAPGETPRAAAIREVEEEIGIRPLQVVSAGRLRFQFENGYRLLGYVFRAADYRGTPIETDEAMPLWYPVDSLPFHRMWADDPLWMPYLLARRYFEGYFIFNGDQMLAYRVDVVPQLDF